MSIYSIGIYLNGTLVRAYLTEPMDEACIDEHVAALSAQYAGHEVACAEHA